MSVSLGSDGLRRPPSQAIARGRFLGHRMSPLPHPSNCRHAKLETMVKFKGDSETTYRCLICNTVVSSREIKTTGE